jgi:branched-chain amino acid aminotransferase
MSENPRFIWVDGKIISWNDATVHVSQLGVSTVSLVYEGIRAYRNDAESKAYVWQLDAHMQRLAQSMYLLRMKSPFSASDLGQATLELLRANQVTTDMYIRPFAYTESMVFSVSASDTPNVVIPTQDMATRLKSGKVSHACISSWTRLSDNVMPPRIKAASNYLNLRYATEEAKRHGYDQALLLKASGKVAESGGACLMIVRDGKIITPSVTSGILESITRDTLIKLCRDVLHIETVEREVDRTELYVADEAFLCGTGAEITPLGSIDRFALGDGKIGPLTEQIENVYHNLVRGIDRRYSEWRTAV